MPSWMVNPGLLKSRGLDVQVTSLKVDSRNSLSSSTQHTIFSFSWVSIKLHRILDFRPHIKGPGGCGSPAHSVSWSSAATLRNRGTTRLAWTWSSSVRRSPLSKAGGHSPDGTGLRWAGGLSRPQGHGRGVDRKGRPGLQCPGKNSLSTWELWKYRFVLVTCLVPTEELSKEPSGLRTGVVVSPAQD